MGGGTLGENQHLSSFSEMPLCDFGSNPSPFHKKGSMQIMVPKEIIKTNEEEIVENNVTMPDIDNMQIGSFQYKTSNTCKE